jgi:hypothetical protein
MNESGFNDEGRPGRPSSSGPRDIMAPAEWHRLEHLFHEAAALPADQRNEWLATATRAEPDLRARVESLLQADAVSSACIHRILVEACLDLVDGQTA